MEPIITSASPGSLIEQLSQPWPWWLVGSAIAFTLFALQYLGQTFGVSSTLRTICSIGGAGRKVPFFDFDWTSQRWNLAFAGGTIVGGFIASQWLMPEQAVHLSQATVQDLTALGVNVQMNELLPADLFSWESLWSLKGIIMLVGSGFLVGFGARYAGGCTSGHAITGLSHLQLPSLIAVIGFFIGGLVMTHWLLPMILQL
jgi:hypothetical protein